MDTQASRATRHACSCSWEVDRQRERGARLDAEGSSSSRMPQRESFGWIVGSAPPVAVDVRRADAAGSAGVVIAAVPIGRPLFRANLARRTDWNGLWLLSSGAERRLCKVRQVRADGVF